MAHNRAKTTDGSGSPTTDKEEKRLPTVLATRLPLGLTAISMPSVEDSEYGQARNALKAFLYNKQFQKGNPQSIYETFSEEIKSLGQVFTDTINTPTLIATPHSDTREIAHSVIKKLMQNPYFTGAEEKMQSQGSAANPKAGAPKATNAKCVSFVTAIRRSKKVCYVSVSGSLIDEVTSMSHQLRSYFNSLAQKNEQFSEHELICCPGASTMFSNLVKLTAGYLDFNFSTSQNCSEISFLAHISKEFHDHPNDFVVTGIVNIPVMLTDRALIKDEQLTKWHDTVNNPTPEEGGLHKLYHWTCCDLCQKNKPIYLVMFAAARNQGLLQNKNKGSLLSPQARIEDRERSKKSLLDNHLISLENLINELNDLFDKLDLEKSSKEIIKDFRDIKQLLNNKIKAAITEYEKEYGKFSDVRSDTVHLCKILKTKIQLQLKTLSNKIVTKQASQGGAAKDGLTPEELNRFDSEVRTMNKTVESLIERLENPKKVPLKKPKKIIPEVTAAAAAASNQNGVNHNAVNQNEVALDVATAMAAPAAAAVNIVQDVNHVIPAQAVSSSVLKVEEQSLNTNLKVFPSNLTKDSVSTKDSSLVTEARDQKSEKTHFVKKFSTQSSATLFANSDLAKPAAAVPPCLHKEPKRKSKKGLSQGR